MARGVGWTAWALATISASRASPTRRCLMDSCHGRGGQPGPHIAKAPAQQASWPNGPWKIPHSALPDGFQRVPCQQGHLIRREVKFVGAVQQLSGLSVVTHLGHPLGGCRDGAEMGAWSGGTNFGRARPKSPHVIQVTARAPSAEAQLAPRRHTRPAIMQLLVLSNDTRVGRNRRQISPGRKPQFATGFGRHTAAAVAV